MNTLPFLNQGFPLNESLSKVPQTTGVYVIHCKLNDFVYFGSAARGFRTRLCRHLRGLDRGIHHSPILQKHYDRYGASAFVFYMVEVCPPSRCLEFEQSWLDLRGVGSENQSYNICSKAGLAPSPKGRKQSEETKRKRALHRVLNPLPPEIVKRIGLRVSEANSREFVATTPDGVEIPFKNLAKFCRENGLIPTQMLNVAKAIHNHHKNWRCRYASESREGHQARLSLLKKNQRYMVTSPDGTQTLVRNLSSFCRKNGLNDAALIAIATGRRRVHKGWKCRYMNESDELREKRSSLKGKDKRYIVTFPDGHQEEVEGLPDFCKQHGLCCSSMTKVAKGKNLQHKGFKVHYAEESVSDRMERLKERKNNREYIVTDPNGNEYQTNNLRKFAKQHNVSHSSLSKLVYGETLDGKSGWKCRLAWETEDERRARVSAKIEAKRQQKTLKPMRSA